DLLYRVNTIEIILPPLRERGGDLALLAEHYLNHYSNKYNKDVHSVSPAALKRMEKYNWPGNVRELQHAVERAVIMSQSNVLQPEDFFFNARQGESSGGDQNDENIQLDQYHLEDVEKILIRKVMKKHNGNITQAATELGLTRSSLYRRLEKYGL
ncbi:MAG: helix-turn-helix domain-containing protein, partial [Cyclobacteriaceae bacterium]